MKIERIPFDQISQFSSRDTEYQLNPEKFAPFIQYLPDLEGIRQAVTMRHDYKVDRQLLTTVLKEQYKDVTLSSKQVHNLDSLSDENTFTITSAHQPSLFTGPSYYVYKILSTIKLADELSQIMPDKHFVPIFVNGGEDHDYEEINHANLFGKTLIWQTSQKGAVGRYNTKGLAEMIKELAGILGENDRSGTIISMYKKAFEEAKTYAEFTQRFLHYLLGELGVLVLNMDDVTCKRAFIPVLKWELSERKSEKLVLETQEKLLDMGFRPQAHPREINLFYFTENGNRERILYENGVYSLAESRQNWTEEEMLRHVEDFPENFSPNVILRPLYQAFILPDIAFVGGGGEIAYWMERKTLFESVNLFFPCLIRRNSVFIIPRHIQKSLQKLNLTFTDFLQDEDIIIHSFIQDIELNGDIFNEEKQIINESWERLIQYMSQYDATLKPYMEAERTKVIKMIDHGEQKVIRSIKTSEEAKVQQIRNVKSKLFPNNGLQERTDNFFQFYTTSENDLISELAALLNPLEKECIVLFL